MTPARHQELREAGPVITARDHERLAREVQRPSRLTLAVDLALAQWRRFYPRKTP